MANDYLRGKWQSWFKVLDVNHDGFLSHEDTDISKETFANLHHLDDKTAASVGANIEAWWKNNVLKSHTGEVSLQQFIDDLNKDYTADKANFISKTSDSFSFGFGIIDVNSDGFISEEEFIVMFKALGHKDEGMMRRMFKSLGPQDGLIAVKAMADAWTDFSSNDDSSVPCKIKEALDTEKM